MKEQTEIMLRSAMSMDPDISPQTAVEVINHLRGEAIKLDTVMKRKDVMRLLRIRSRTVDNYVAKGFLEKVYGGKMRAIGISRESFIRFTRRRTPGK